MYEIKMYIHIVTKASYSSEFGQDEHLLPVLLFWLKLFINWLRRLSCTDNFSLLVLDFDCQHSVY